MEARSINFGNEKNITFQSSFVLPSKIEETLVNYRILEDWLYLQVEKEQYGLRAVNTHQKEILEHLVRYEGHALIRVDKISGLSVVITVFTYSGVAHFTGSEMFSIVVNSAINITLSNFNINKSKLNLFFSSEFLCGDRCFAILSRDGDLNKATLIGENYYCTIEQTKQNIMQVVNLRKRRKNSYVQGSILLLRGNIQFQDLLNYSSQQSEETQRKFRESVKDNQQLLNLWSLYNELETLAMKQEVKELGAIKYYDAIIMPGNNGKSVAVFKLDKKLPSSFLQTNLGYAVVSEENFNEKDITESRKSLFVGDTAVQVTGRGSVLNNELHIILYSDLPALPLKGYVMASFAGSKVMAERRERALGKIDACNTPLLDLKLLLQTGETVNEIRPKHYEPVNDKLLKKIFGTKNITFTERQREAIDIAVNTPDMAIIQGPPGTGKTTVIRAIIARLGELYKGNVKILVSSAQHDAVDNAIENVEYGGLPVNRLGGRASDNELKSNSYIWKWIQQISHNCETFLEHEGVSETRAVYRSIMLLIEECRDQMEDHDFVKQQLVAIYKQISQLGVADIVVKELETIITRLERNRIIESLPLENSETAELYQLLEGQRVTKTAFMDDGPVQLSKLVRFLRLSQEIQYVSPQFWTSLRLGPSSEQLDELLPLFIQSLNELKGIIFGSVKDEESIYTDEILLSRDIESVFTSILNDIIRKASMTRDSLANVIWEFKDELENPTNIAELLEKYTKINAATCQQSVSPKASNLKLRVSIEYDYVIIDEAARANPLDLLIPMSLGKKIILVGDHNQLPHLLENDLVQEVIKRKKDSEVGELLKETLFARIYTMLDKTKYTSVKRTVMLNDQYRMHPVIGNFVSTFYKEPLRSPLPIEAKQHNLGLYDNKPVAWINVSSSAGLESPSRYSKSRDVEVKVLMSELQKILHANRTFTIGIITFYKSQAMKIQEELESLTQQDQMRISAGTVDAFQGKEFDVVLLSTVRSNSHYQLSERVGFLDSRNRLCVAFSRGKRLVAVVGDSETVASDGSRTIVSELKRFYDLCKIEGYYEQKH